MAYGQTISLARRARGYSQEALAEQCGVSRQAVSRWEQGAAYPETGGVRGMPKKGNPTGANELARIGKGGVQDEKMFADFGRL